MSLAPLLRARKLLLFSLVTCLTAFAGAQTVTNAKVINSNLTTSSVFDCGNNSFGMSYTITGEQANVPQELRIIRPDGSVHPDSYTYPGPSEDKATDTHKFVHTWVTVDVDGPWKMRLVVNGQVLAELPFTVRKPHIVLTDAQVLDTNGNPSTTFKVGDVNIGVAYTINPEQYGIHEETHLYKPSGQELPFYWYFYRTAYISGQHNVLIWHWNFTKPSEIDTPGIWTMRIIVQGSVLETLHFKVLPSYSYKWQTKLSETSNPSLRPRTYVTNPNTDDLLNLSRYQSMAVQTGQVTVLDGGNPVGAGVPVTIAISGSNHAAGHSHSSSSSNIHGWVFADPKNPVDDDGKPITSAFSVPENYPGGSKAKTITLTTDQNGVATFGYIPAEIAGSDTISVYVSDSVATKVSTAVTTELAGLTAVTRTGALNLVTETPVLHTHPWFGTTFTNNALANASALFVKYQKDPSGLPTALQGLSAAVADLGTYNGKACSRTAIPLGVQDLSLITGGMFDAEGNFAAPHGGHRSGKDSDIQISNLLTSLPSAVQWSKLTESMAVDDSTQSDAVRKAIRQVNLIRARILIYSLSEAGALRLLSETTGQQIALHVDWQY